jgi:REP element-mobilizing transposase RayT
MTRPIVIAYHLIWTIYGYWLPNDPRGSTSKTIRDDIISDLGQIHFGRKQIQPASRDLRIFWRDAKARLKFPIIEFTSPDVAVIAEAFARGIAACKYTCYACVVMPDHVHVLIRKHKHLAEEMIPNLQRESHLLLRERKRFDLAHPIWGGPGWKVFLDQPDEIWRTIVYIEQNPVKIGLPVQTWDFITPYNNWPLHEGHSPNSPYAKRMRRDSNS